MKKTNMIKKGSKVKRLERHRLLSWSDNHFTVVNTNGLSISLLEKEGWWDADKFELTVDMDDNDYSNFGYKDGLYV